MSELGQGFTETLEEARKIKLDWLHYTARSIRLADCLLAAYEELTVLRKTALTAGEAKLILESAYPIGSDTRVKLRAIAARVSERDELRRRADLGATNDP